MNAEKFDIEKMLEADAQSIEIDQDFKAKLKANIMKNNSSFENDNIIDFNAKSSENTIKESRDFKPYRKYLKIASSFAIVGLIGFRVGVGNLGFAKVEKPVNDIKVVEREVFTVTLNNEVASANDGIEPKAEEKSQEDQEEVVAKASENEGTNTDNGKTEINKGSNDNTEVNEEPASNKTEPDLNDQKNIEPEQNDKSNELYAVNDEGSEDPIEEVTDNNPDDRLKKDQDSHYASPNESTEESELKLASYAEDHQLDLYFGTLSMIEDGEFILENNNVYINNEESKELIFTQEDNYVLKAIKKLNDNEVLLFKASSEEKGSEYYQLSKFDTSTKEESLLVVEAESIILNNTYDKLAFEINNDIIITDIKSEKQEKVLKGKNIAWSPDGRYLSYVKTVREENQGEKIKTYSLFVVYDSEENKEITLAENELIVKNDYELIGTYNYGENLWSKDNNCIYVIRDNVGIMSDIDGNKKQVIKLTVTN